MKTGYRIQQLDQFVNEDYDHIWDCCCDHGLLGMLLLKRNAAEVVHFVDIVPSLISDLEIKLNQHFPQSETKGNWLTYCMDVAQLNLETHQPLESRSLIIIAGVGGDRVIEILGGILSRYPKHHFEFLLSPVHHNFKLRSALINWKFGLVKEKLIWENNRYYELIHISSKSKKPLTQTGSSMWDFDNKHHLEYLRRTVRHFQQKAKDPKNKISHILNAYLALQDKVIL